MPDRDRGLRLAALIVVLVFASACGSLAGASPAPSASRTSAPPSPSSPAPAGRLLPPADAQGVVSARVAAALDALKRRDGVALASLAHPTKGVRFTPYPFVRAANDVVLARADLAKGYSDPTTRTWGVTDGRGDPITLTFADYSARYVWTRDFLAAPKTAYNRTIGSGNSIDNTATVYPNAVLFEAYDPGPDPAMESVRWQCLRLLFEPDGDAWYLVGVVHGEWTI